jgi:endonuclease/exonuclease/phosphatase family metal-dependent hydrolase
VSWLSCAITSLGVDILAVQEFKLTARARQAQSQLIDQLNQRTGGDWQIELSSCDPEDVQHPGFVFDASRVKGSQFREIVELNPFSVCSNDASPGFAGYFEIEGGPDFHFVSVHFPSGDGQSALDARSQALAAMPAVASAARALVDDEDLIFAGDFNTSGCAECDSPVESTSEIDEMRASFDEKDNPLHALGADQACSREDDANSHLLDHFVNVDNMTEVPSDATAHVGGFCAEGACDRLQLWHVDARAHLSDHCPILLDLESTDDD